MSDPRNEPPRYGERVPGASAPAPTPAPVEPSSANTTQPQPPQQLFAQPRPALGARVSSAWVTYLLIAVCVVVFIAQYATDTNGQLDGPVSQGGVFYSPYAISQPWRFVTQLFLHANLLHIASNMFSLFIMGPQLERLIGHWRFAVLYFLSGFAGGVAVELLIPNGASLGASGAIFGILGAYFIVARRLGGNVTQIVAVIAINLAIGFYVPNIAWQAHVGGLIVGALVALVYSRPRTDRNGGSSGILLVAIAAALAVIAVAASLMAPG